MSELDCACGHPQSWHKSGVGRCEHGCGCLAVKLHARGGVEVLAELDPGRPPFKAPTYQVRCRPCGRQYPTTAWLREIATRKGCRACADARRVKNPNAGQTRPGDLPSTFACGTRSAYVCGCRCDACREANNAYARMRGKLVRAGASNPMVDAKRVRRHLVKLSNRGIGRETIGEASGVASSSVDALRTGKKTKLRKETAAKILAVGPDVVTDGTLVDASSTWRKIERLLAEGFTRGAIALRLGMKKPALQLRSPRVTARTRMRVERLYREVTGAAR